MSVFSSKSFDGHETVAFHSDAKTGLQAIIALHSTTLGPALGGCRMWDYVDDEAALTDVLRLSRGSSGVTNPILSWRRLIFGGSTSAMTRAERPKACATAV